MRLFRFHEKNDKKIVDAQGIVFQYIPAKFCNFNIYIAVSFLVIRVVHLIGLDFNLFIRVPSI